MTVDMSSSPRSARGLVFVPHPRAAGGLCSVTAAICTSDTSVERELLSGLVAVPQRGCQLRTFCVAAGTHHVLVPLPVSRLQDAWVGPRLGLGMPGTARAHVMVWTRTFASLGGHAGRQVQAELGSTLTPAPPTFPPGRERGPGALPSLRRASPPLWVGVLSLSFPPWQSAPCHVGLLIRERDGPRHCCIHLAPLRGSVRGLE